MAFMEKLIGKSQDIDIDDFLNNLENEEEDPYQDADAFVKPITLQADPDVNLVLQEAKNGNIILLNIGDLSKRNGIKLKELVNRIKDGVDSMNGDIARITQDRIIVTPSRVKIIKRRD
ncbi:MAG TPA: cell division protein SepF [archaeon]|nr:cell division protein SepF [archaeon]